MSHPDNSSSVLPVGRLVRLRDSSRPHPSRGVILSVHPDGAGYSVLQEIAEDAVPGDSHSVWEPTPTGWETPPEPPVRLRISQQCTVSLAAVEDLATGLREEGITEMHRQLALWHTRVFARRQHRAFSPKREAKSSNSGTRPSVPYAGRVFDEDEVAAAVSSSLEFWLTLGENGARFEEALAEQIGVRRTILTNSGSSANLLAVSSLTGALLSEKERLRPGDEVITCAAGFPTTVAPILQNGLIPVFIDNNPITTNADVAQLEAAYQPGKTRAVIFAHTLGNPFDLGTVLAFCQRHGLWLIEDNCDALGSTYTLPTAEAQKLGIRRAQHAETPNWEAWTGSFGDLSTQSFYPPHHLTMGEGGAVNIRDNMRFKRIVESIRDWGRDCWCPSGQDNTCGKRFQWQLGDLPEGYDHKYIYSHLGYNLKPLDLQAAIGLVQLQRLHSFGATRRRNWQYLRAGLADLNHCFGFMLPTHATGWTEKGFTWENSANRCDPSWFGFLLRVRPEAPFSRADLARALDAAGIGNRGLFGGNLLRQPVFTRLRRERPEAFRVAGPLPGADRIMREAIFLGVYPGLGTTALDYVIEFLHDFCKR